MLKVIIISISIWIISTTVQANKLPGETNSSLMPNPVWIEDDQMNFPIFLFRWTQYAGMKLKKSEKQQHQSAVFFMLDNVPDGQIVSWYSDKRLANGKVRVIHSYPISGGYCRTYQIYIKIKTKKKHTTNNACRYLFGESWLFYK